MSEAVEPVDEKVLVIRETDAEHIASIPEAGWFCEAYPPAGINEPGTAFTTTHTVDILNAGAEKPVRVIAEYPLLPVFLPINVRGLGWYSPGLSALAYSIDVDAGAVVFIGEGDEVAKAIQEAGVVADGKAGPYTRDAGKLYWWAVLIRDDPDLDKFVQWLRMLYSGLEDLDMFLREHHLLPQKKTYVLTDGKVRETWDQWEGVIVSAALWYSDITDIDPGFGDIIEGDTAALCEAITRWENKIALEINTDPDAFTLTVGLEEEEEAEP